MLDPTKLQYLNSQWQARNQARLAQEQAAATAAAKPQKGFWTDQISTGGSMAGAAGGAALGASIGSAVPGIGTAIGGLLGAILGGAAGGAGGQVAENAVAGDNLGKDVGSEALWGGLTSVGPLKALSIGKGLAKGVGEAVLKDGGSAAIKAGVEQGIAATPIRDALSKAGVNLGKAGDRLIASQANVTGAQARNAKLNPIKTMGNITNRTGLTNINDMAEFAPLVTGGGDKSVLDTLTNAAIGDAGPVAIGDLRATAQKLIEDKGALLSDSQRKNLLNHVKNVSVSMYGGSKGSLSALADPMRALEQANNLRAVARDAVNGFNVSPDQKELGNIYNQLAKQIEDALYSAPGTAKNLTAITKSGSNDLLLAAQELEKSGKTAQANAARKLAQEVKGATSVQQLRTMKKDFVDLGKIDALSAQADGARSITGKDMTKTAGSLLRNPLEILAKPLDAASPTVGGALKAAATKMPTSTAPGAITPGGAMLRAGLYQAPFNSGDASQVTQPVQGQDAGTTMMPSDQTQSIPDATGTGSPFPYTSAQLGQAMMQALANNDTKSASVLKQMYDLASSYEQSAASPMNTTTQKALTSSANGEAALQRLEATYQAAGGGKGPIGGYASGILGAMGLDPNAKVYNDTVASTAAQLARAMGETGVLSDTDIKRYMSMLPTLQDTPEAAARKLALIRQALTTTHDNAALYGAGASSTDLASQLGL